MHTNFFCWITTGQDSRTYVKMEESFSMLDLQSFVLENSLRMAPWS